MTAAQKKQRELQDEVTLIRAKNQNLENQMNDLCRTISERELIYSSLKCYRNIETLYSHPILLAPELSSLKLTNLHAQEEISASISQTIQKTVEQHCSAIQSVLSKKLEAHGQDAEKLGKLLKLQEQDLKADGLLREEEVEGCLRVIRRKIDERERDKRMWDDAREWVARVARGDVISDELVEKVKETIKKKTVTQSRPVFNDNMLMID